MRNGCEGIGCGVAANLQAGDASGGPIFSSKTKKIGEKRAAWLCLVRLWVQFRQAPIIESLRTHIVTLRALWYAPPVTAHQV